MKKWLKNKLFSTLNVSFSKSGEDVQLRKLIGASDPGAYVDVGCWDPKKASNSYFFYLRKWKGICIDPNPGLIVPYQQIRPDDTFLNMAISTREGELKYYMFDENHDSMNTLDQDFVSLHHLEDKIIQTKQVPVKTLKSVLDQHLAQEDRLDFFDIDVEGFDLEVLKSNDWEKYRPKIILCEADEPLEMSLSSDITLYLKEKDYKLIGKSCINENLGNLYYLRK